MGVKIKRNFIKTIFNGKHDFLNYVNEIRESGILDHLNEAKKEYRKFVNGKTYRGCPYTFGAISNDDGVKIYALVRKKKPKILVETGVCNGISTSLILLALNKNNSGKLYSIDFPEVEGFDYEDGTFWEGKAGAVIPKNKEPGWAVPQSLRKRWVLILGKSQKKLPILLRKLRRIDFFMHDSEHSYECMMFEYNEAYKYFNKGGLLVSDDITWNDSFYDFCNENALKLINISKNIGLIVI